MKIAKEWPIDQEDAERRVDNFLFSRLKTIPKSRLYRAIRTGDVRVNGKRAKSETRLQAGDILQVRGVLETPTTAATGDKATARILVPQPLIEEIEAAILYEDDDLLVLNKPSGLSVHAGTGFPYGLIETLRHMRPHQKGLELIHRLDKPTSGCLLIGKRGPVVRAWQKAFHDRKVKKVYLAWVKGNWTHGREYQCDLPLSSHFQDEEKVRIQVDRKGKPARTLFRCLEVQRGVSLLEARPETGRTHQIRVHLAALGNPIIGDRKYGDRMFNQAIKSQGVGRLMLHAQSIDYQEAKGRHWHFETDFPKQDQKVLEALKKVKIFDRGSG